MGPTTTGFGQETGYIMDWSPNNFRADLLCGIENQALSCTPKGNSESSMNHTCIYFWNLEHLENMQTAHKFEPRTSNCEVDMLTTRLPGCLVYTLSITNTQYCVCCFCITDISVSECIKCFYVRVYVTLPPQCWILPLVIDKQKKLAASSIFPAVCHLVCLGFCLPLSYKSSKSNYCSNTGGKDLAVSDDDAFNV